jgi:hypothetical protein
MLRRIYGTVKDRDQWRSRYNKEPYDLFKEPRLSVTIRIARLTLDWSCYKTGGKFYAYETHAYATGMTKKRGKMARQVAR